MPQGGYNTDIEHRGNKVSSVYRPNVKFSSIEELRKYISPSGEVNKKKLQNYRQDKRQAAFVRRLGNRSNKNEAV